MKRTFKRPDGTEEVIEGSAEELAEYERHLREGTKSPKPPGKGKKPVLHGASIDDIPLTDDEVLVIRLRRIGLLPMKEFSPPFSLPYIPPYWCSICGIQNCNTTHITFTEPVYTTTAGTSIKLTS